MLDKRSYGQLIHVRICEGQRDEAKRLSDESREVVNKTEYYFVPLRRVVYLVFGVFSDRSPNPDRIKTFLVRFEVALIAVFVLYVWSTFKNIK